MIRAAIYARFSDDSQNEKSVDDQIAFCREICAREGMTVAMTFEDRAISGASSVNRPGFLGMMRTANAGLFDVIVAESMDRLFRDQADYHTARKQLDFLGIKVHVAGGRVGRLDGALRAMVSEIFLDDLAVHVRRGLEAVVRDGRHAGGRAYGYAIVPGKKGELKIDDAEAAIVRRIFAEFCAGRTPRAIAASLNADRIKPPRGNNWNASTINGNSARGHGMLLNELYVGRIVWNKVRMIKDPATGKRISRVNPKAEHRSAEVPHLRIVDAATWSAAQLIKQSRSHAGATRSRVAKRPLSGLLRCGSCGGGMASVGETNGTHRVQCSTFKESGGCGNGRKVSRDAIEHTVFAGLREELMHPAAIAEYVRTYNAERRRLAKGSGDQVAKLTRRDAAIGRELERLIDAVAQGVALGTLVPRIKALELERAGIAADLAQATAAHDVIALHPAAIEQYAADVTKLASAAAAHADLAESAELIATMRRLVQEVVIFAEPNARGFAVEVKGRLAELAGFDAFPGRSSRGGIDGSERGTRPIPPPGSSPLFMFRRTARAA